MPRPSGTLVPHLPTCRSGLRCRQALQRLQVGPPGSCRCCVCAAMETGPGLVARRQSPKAHGYWRGKRLEPPAFQGSLPYYPSAREPRWVLWGFLGQTDGGGARETRSWEKALEGLIWGALGRGRACPRSHVKEKPSQRSLCQASVVPAQTLGTDCGDWPCSPRE